MRFGGVKVPAHDEPSFTPMMMANPEGIQELQRQMAAAKQQDAVAQRLSNDHLKELAPEEVVARLKGVLYRIAPILKLSEMIQMDFGSEVLAASLRSSVGALVDAVKWISWHTDQDPFSKFGDDTLLVMARDVLLGDDLGRRAEEQGGRQKDSESLTEELDREMMERLLDLDGVARGGEDGDEEREL